MMDGVVTPSVLAAEAEDRETSIIPISAAVLAALPDNNTGNRVGWLVGWLMSGIIYMRRMRIANHNYKFAVTVLAVLCIMKIMLLSTRPQYDDGGDSSLPSKLSLSPFSSSPYSEFVNERSRDKEEDVHSVITPAMEQQRPPHPAASFHAHPPKHGFNRANDITTSNFTTSSSLSDAPLFFHISPGTSGSTFLYHATCTAGFPSVHHKSFCISQQRGIENVSESVVEGVRSHFELIRLYSLAYECCRIMHTKKGKEKKNTNNIAQLLQKQNLCRMPLHSWISEMQRHLTSILQSGLVGLFDTPYPFLAQKVLELAKKWRTTPPIISITERNPKEWARSRIKNHGLLVCKTEYSHERLGASEFDILGCYERATQVATTAVARRGSDDNANTTVVYPLVVRHFWDIFQYRPRVVNDSDVDPTFQLGMERQMRHYQEVYSPVADYTPDMFGVHSTSSRLEEEDVVVNIQQLILAGKGNGDINDDIPPGLRLHWRNEYTKPLTCRARVNWDMDNDTLWEFYHRPNTCAVNDALNGVIPLINTHDIDAR